MIEKIALSVVIQIIPHNNVYIKVTSVAGEKDMATLFLKKFVKHMFRFWVTPLTSVTYQGCVPLATLALFANI